jgi:hypothetical protein
LYQPPRTLITVHSSDAIEQVAKKWGRQDARPTFATLFLEAKPKEVELIGGRYLYLAPLSNADLTSVPLDLTLSILISLQSLIIMRSRH